MPILLKNQTSAQLQASLAHSGLSPHLARRLLAAAIKRGELPDPGSHLTARLRDDLLALTQIPHLTTVQKVVSSRDGFAKYLFQRQGAGRFEAVRIPLLRGAGVGPEKALQPRRLCAVCGLLDGLAANFDPVAFASKDWWLGWSIARAQPKRSPLWANIPSPARGRKGSRIMQYSRCDLLKCGTDPPPFVRLYLVCLMPYHLHLLLETPGGNLSNFMARLVTAYSVYYNLRHHRSYAAIPQASLMERRRGSLARAAAAWALVRHAGLTQRGAAAALGMRTGAAVSQQLTRWPTVVSRDQSWQAIVAELDQRLGRANY